MVSSVERSMRAVHLTGRLDYSPGLLCEEKSCNELCFTNSCFDWCVTHNHSLVLDQDGTATVQVQSTTKMPRGRRLSGPGQKNDGCANLPL
ncbi:hypothetical protein F5Y15DRAFT_399706 [Xylariaceae sp. FL0016]|nr:hypothetical protein F5Y15DRAFT_399706 [Xylariaceae sp. FL0016]